MKTYTLKFKVRKIGVTYLEGIEEISDWNINNMIQILQSELENRASKKSNKGSE